MYMLEQYQFLADILLALLYQIELYQRHLDHRVHVDTFSASQQVPQMREGPRKV